MDTDNSFLSVLIRVHLWLSSASSASRRWTLFQEQAMQPKLAAFPKAFMDPLCVTADMSVPQWIDLAATLNIDGLEFYSGFLGLCDPRTWPVYKKRAADKGLTIP